MLRTITLDLPSALDAILVEKATGVDTPETLAARVVGEWCQPFATAKDDELKLAMASNERLMALGVAVIAQPEKLDEVEAAVKSVLS